MEMMDRNVGVVDAFRVWVLHECCYGRLVLACRNIMALLLLAELIV